MSPASRAARRVARAPLLLLTLLLVVSPTLGWQPAGALRPVPRELPGTPAFQRVWERTDQPVASGATARTWMWGPDAFTGVLQEDYAESPGGKRQVQYFDKSRMEITHPDAGDDGLWYVTNGLLVVELISGWMQVGDDTFIKRSPAQVNVAGDADDPLGPTYATFALLLDDPAREHGATIYERVSRDGVVTEDPSLAVHNIQTAHLVEVPGISHQVAAPFWTFMNSSGVVYQDGAYVEDALFINPFYATGYPITEAYWASVKVAGTYRDVLMQCFERRCLTYTPGNPPGFLTEAGNVGQHYHTWRYAQPADDLLINEVNYYPDAGSDVPAYIELFNPTAVARDLSGAVLTNGSGTNSIELPAWVLPPGAYLTVYLGNGTPDADLSDGSGEYFFDPGSDPFFSIEDDAVALYRDTPDEDTLVDFVAWSATGSAPSGQAYDHAVALGIWPVGAYYDAANGPIDAEADQWALRLAVLPGESIGRNAAGSDSNAPSDFAPYGGVDAAGPTPGAANQSTFDDYIENAPLALGLGRAQPRPQQQAAPLPKKAWTIMVFIDGRDANLLPAWRSDINRMEEEGSNANVNIVVQLMRPNAERDRLQRFYIERETTSTIRNPVQTINDAAQAAPGDPATLAAFIDWAELNYPANHYAIVLAGHGNGWKGTMIAGARVDHLTMSEVDTGLAALDSGKFEVLVWYSCLMGQTEVAYQMQKRSKYMVASEEITWANTIPWQTFVAQLKTNLGWTPRQFGDELALKWADVLQTQAASRRIYTMASVDLDVVRPTLGNALTAFATQLRGDIASIINQLDNPTDNVQIRVKREARERAETFQDRNFIDTYHFAELVKGMGIPASGLAQPVMNAVLNSTTVIRHGRDRANAHGLSIYFPHDALQPNRHGGTWGRAFDDPLHDPYDSRIPTAGTHYYKRDATLLVPKIRNLEYPFKDDPDFDFPANTTWDELLHRYYKPVADACIRHGGKCVKEVRVRVGTTLTLSGNGSSDSDGREGPSNDVPAHVGGIEHYYWDFKPDVDTGGARPPYADNVEYVDCDGEDCDRDDVDETNDDKDAQGKTVTFTCTEPGTFPIHFMVWDEHHNEKRERVENINVNRGRHWLHFNVDESDVTIHCYAEKSSKPEKASVNEPIEYLITIVANAELSDVAPGAMTDQLPVEVVVDGEVTCTNGECFYDSETHTVHWIGNLEPESEVEIKVPVRIPPREPSDPPLPPEIVNCATLFDGVESRQACTVTEILPPLET